MPQINPVIHKVIPPRSNVNYPATARGCAPHWLIIDHQHPPAVVDNSRRCVYQLNLRAAAPHPWLKTYRKTYRAEQLPHREPRAMIRGPRSADQLRRTADRCRRTAGRCAQKFARVPRLSGHFYRDKIRTFRAAARAPRARARR